MKNICTPAAGVLVLCTVLAASALAGSGAIRIAHDPGTIVLEYSRLQNEPRQDPLPLMRIYGDGMVWVHYPVGADRAGDYEFRLERVQLRQLLRDIKQAGLLDFDRARTLRQRAAMHRDDADSAAAIDTVVRIRLLRYNGQADFDKTIVWTNVDDDARVFPGLSVVQQLARLERTLRAMIDNRLLSPLELPLAQR